MGNPAEYVYTPAGNLTFCLTARPASSTIGVGRREDLRIRNQKVRVGSYSLSKKR